MNDTDPSATQQQDGIAWLAFLVMIARNQKLVLWFPVGAGILALIVTFLVPKWYAATARIMPPQQSQSNAVAILGQLGVIAGGGASQALGLKNPSDVYVAMLKSRTVADKLVQRFNLREEYRENLLEDARKELARNSSINAGREGVITITVEDKSAKRAAEIANAYAEELRHLTIHLAVSEASQRRLFFEGQLQRAKDDLASAEVELRKYTQDAGLVNPQGQIGLSVAAAAALRAQISAREIQLSAMRSFATDSNPDVARMNRELGGLRTELAKMETDPNPGKGDVLVPFGKAPGVGLEYVRKYRNMKYFETLYEVLAKQYEIARIDEAKDATLIQVLDVALAPEKRSKPLRALTILVTMFCAVVLGIVMAAFLDAWRRTRNDPRREDLLLELRRLIPKRWTRPHRRTSE